MGINFKSVLWKSRLEATYDYIYDKGDGFDFVLINQHFFNDLKVRLGITKAKTEIVLDELVKRGHVKIHSHDGKVLVYPNPNSHPFND